MKLRNLIEIEYGVHDLLTQHTDQIKSDSGPNTYRMLQTQLALGKNAWVKDWLIKNGYEKENPTPLKEVLKKDGHLYNVEEVGEISAMGLGSVPMDVAYVGDDGMLGNNSTFISWKDVKRLMDKYSSSKDFAFKEQIKNQIRNHIRENLRNWFKKEKWKRIDTQGNIAGDCGTMPKGKATQRCLPLAKAKRLTKAERAATTRKKVEGSKKGKQFVSNTEKAKVKFNK